MTGSADGLGRAAAQTLLDDGHDVVVHARHSDRLTAVHDLVDRGAAVVVGDLADLEQTHGIARDVNSLGLWVPINRFALSDRVFGTHTYVVDGDVLRFVFETGIALELGRPYELKWSVYRNKLTFSAVKGSEPLVAFLTAPYTRVP